MRACLRRSAVLVIVAVAAVAQPSLGAEKPNVPGLAAPDEETAKRAHPAKPIYSPYAGRSYPTRPFFGDTHLHTGFSFDAGAFGARLSPRDAYRFARGEEVTASSGQPARLSRPLDFLVVTDHSDGMGFFPLLLGGDSKMLAYPQGRKWFDMIQSGKGAAAGIFSEPRSSSSEARRACGGHQR